MVAGETSHAVTVSQSSYFHHNSLMGGSNRNISWGLWAGSTAQVNTCQHRLIINRCSSWGLTCGRRRRGPQVILYNRSPPAAVAANAATSTAIALGFARRGEHERAGCTFLAPPQPAQTAKAPARERLIRGPRAAMACRIDILQYNHVNQSPHSAAGSVSILSLTVRLGLQVRRRERLQPGRGEGCKRGNPIS